MPHFTTFQKAADRLLLVADVRKLLEATLDVARVQGRLKKRCELAALDGTGLRGAPRQSLLRETTRQLQQILAKDDVRDVPQSGRVVRRGQSLDLGRRAATADRGLTSRTFGGSLDDALSRKPITTLVADAGYDAEHVHEYAREECGVNTFIPPLIGRPTNKKPTGFWRRRMASRLHLSRYRNGGRSRPSTVCSND